MNAIMIDPKRIWKTSDLDYCVAEELFGWKWLAYLGIPVRDTPGYPNKVLVRQFFSPGIEANKHWLDYFAHKGGGFQPATGDEPLSYRYCSSQGPEMVPYFSGHQEAMRAMEEELDRRNLFDDYQKHIAAQLRCLNDDETFDVKKVRNADCETRCIAALAAVGSKYVTQNPPDDAA